MGTGGKLNPLSLKVADIKSTNTCPLARVMRRELKARGIENVLVVYSTEEPKGDRKIAKSPPSMIFVPATAGLVIAKEVVEYLISR
jgi:tRNA A37 threonylcarbamoyladenosine dehydratase